MEYKNLKLGIIALLGTLGVSAQDVAQKDVPSKLKTTFQQAYPNATDVEWEKEGEIYKVEFDINWKDHEIWYAVDGSPVKMEKDIKKKDLPKAVRSAIADKYAGYRIDSIEMAEKGGSTTYKVELEKGWDEEKQVVFDTDGKVLSEWNN